MKLIFFQKERCCGKHYESKMYFLGNSRVNSLCCTKLDFQLLNNYDCICVHAPVCIVCMCMCVNVCVCVHV